MLAAAGMQAALAGSIASVASTAHAQTPRKGGRIKVAGSTAAVSDTLDPAKQSNGTDYVRGFMFYNGLTYLDGSLTPQPQLAEEFTTQDAKTWVFKLRKGVTFHDGKSLTPQDVIFSLMRHKNPATASRAKPLADQIEEVAATGPNEVTIRLATPNADLPVILGTYHFHIVKDGTTDFNAGIGTGPYKVKEFKPGVRAVALRNDNYWKPNRPYLDEIEHVGIGDESARVNGLLAGDLDLVLSIDPRSVSRVTGSSQHAIFETKAGPYADLIMRRDSAPGNNADFVQGMKHLFNREQMIKSIMLGHGVVANDHPIHPSMRFHFKGLKQRPYDPGEGEVALPARQPRVRGHPDGRVSGRDRIHRDRDDPAARGAQGRCQLRHAPHAGGRLLGPPLDEAPRGIRHDPAAPLRRRDAFAVLQVRRPPERVRLEKRQVRPAPACRARRDR